MAEIPIDNEGHLRLVLDYLGEELEPSILIGGWATVARVGGEISLDIDLIIGSPEVREKVWATLSEVSESNHLQGTKWRGSFEGRSLYPASIRARRQAAAQGRGVGRTR